MMSKIYNALVAGFGNTTFSTTVVAVSLVVSAVLGMYVYLIYGLATKDSLYSRSFHKMAAALPIVTTGIMLAMQSSLIVSIGSLGALSLVRFRNSVKDSMDMIFLLWSVSLGVICGSRMYFMGVLLSLLLTVVIFALELVGVLRQSPYLLVVSGSTEGDVDNTVKTAAGFAKGQPKVASRTLTTHGFDLVIELHPTDDAALVKAVGELPGVLSVSLVDRDGEIHG